MAHKTGFSHEEFQEAEEMARRIMRHHFGTDPGELTRETGGLSNFVFTAKNSEGAFIVRIRPKGGSVSTFLKEQWATARAREAGVPATEVLEVGCEVVPHAYTIARKANGTPALLHPARREIVAEMGRYAGLINSIPTNGFGGKFDLRGEALCKSWREFLQLELKVDEKIAMLEDQGMLAASAVVKLREALAHKGVDGQRPLLNHGDLRLKNMVVNEEGRITAILDWDNSSSNPAPQWEMSLALHDLSVDEKQDFIAAYGMSQSDYWEMAPLIKALNIVNYAGHVAGLLKKGERAQLDECRTRLSGALDLYSL